MPSPRSLKDIPLVDALPDGYKPIPIASEKRRYGFFHRHLTELLTGKRRYIPEGGDAPLSPKEVAKLLARYPMPATPKGGVQNRIGIEDGLYSRIDELQKLSEERLKKSKPYDPGTFGGFLHEKMSDQEVLGQELSARDVAMQMNLGKQLKRRVTSSMVVDWRGNNRAPNEERLAALSSVLKLEPGGEDQQKLDRLAVALREELRERRRKSIQ